MWVDLPFELIGKLNLSPEEAREMFGFEMKEGGRGVIFQRRKGRIFMRTLVYPREPWNKRQKGEQEKFRVLARIAKEERDLIYPVWSKIKGYRWITTFMGINLRRIGRGRWEEMLITKGDIISPSILYVKVLGCEILLGLEGRGKGVGIGLLRLKDFSFYHIGVRCYRDLGCIRVKYEGVKGSDFIIYVYFKEGDRYSDSASYVVRRGDGGV